MSRYDFRCDACGKFMTAQKGSSWVFVPDSLLTTEENSQRCVLCTKKYGKITPNQLVRIDLCCGIIGSGCEINYD
jgi:hypothetical protein